MYAGDSFFTLAAGGQAGLVAVSAALGLGMICLTWALARRRRRAIRLGIWAALFLGYLWLSPQFFYLYYLMIIDGLPLQWVIGAWPDAAAIARDLFAWPRTMAADARLTLGIAMLIAALAAGLDRGRQRTHQNGTHGQGRKP